MNEILFKFWLILGVLCILVEFIIPGLVVIFIGLGALSVVFALHYGFISNIQDQLLTFFITSIIYLFTLRFLILKLFPTNTKKENINEDENVIGTVVEVCEKITPTIIGRVIHSDSTWKAKTISPNEFEVGEKVKIIGRENITWIVDKI